MAENINNIEIEQSKSGSYNQLQERLNITNEMGPCDKCSSSIKNRLVYSCEHKLCFNCILKCNQEEV